MTVRKSLFGRLILFLLIASVLFGNIGKIGVYASDNEYKTFIQSDPRWGSNCYQGGNTLAMFGCMITSIAILMAYADPDLRDVNTWNPWIAAQGLSFDERGCIHWGSTVNIDPGFTVVENKKFGGPVSESKAREYVKARLDEGLYVIVCGAGLYGGADDYHYSPIVGWDKASDKPIVWDVAGGGKTWDDWAVNTVGIDQILSYSSTKNKSYDVLGKSSNEANVNKELTAEQKEAVNAVVKEWELVGMGGEEHKFLADVALPTANSLSDADRVSMENIKSNIVDRKLAWYDYARIGVSFLGLCCVIYGLLLGLAYLFDRTNNLLEISLLGIITLGKYRVWEEDYGVEKGYDRRTGKMYCDAGMLIFRIAIVEIVGFVLLSGWLFRLAYRLLSFILERM